MKYLNFTISVVLLLLSLYLFTTIKSDFDLVVCGVTMCTGIIFFLFGLIEENKEEIERLRRLLERTGKLLEKR